MLNFDFVGKRLFMAVVGLVAGFVGTKFLAPEQAQAFMDYSLAVLAAYIGGQSLSDSVKAWKAPEAPK